VVRGWDVGWLGCLWVGKFSIAILWFISFAPKLLYFDSRQTNVRIEIKRKAATGSSSSQWKTCEKHARLKEVDEGFSKGVGVVSFRHSTQSQSETPDPGHDFGSDYDSGSIPSPTIHPHALPAGLADFPAFPCFLFVHFTQREIF